MVVEKASAHFIRCHPIVAAIANKFRGLKSKDHHKKKKRKHNQGIIPKIFNTEINVGDRATSLGSPKPVKSLESSTIIQRTQPGQDKIKHCGSNHRIVNIEWSHKSVFSGVAEMRRKQEKPKRFS